MGTRKYQESIIQKYGKKGFPAISGYVFVSSTTGENIEVLLEQAALKAKEQLAADPATQALVWQQFGHTLIEMGQYNQAEQWLQKALKQQRSQKASF